MSRLVLAAIVALGLASGLGPSLGLGLGPSPAAASANPPMTERQVEPQPRGRSGFWTSPHPAKGGAYRWRLLGIGVVLAAGAGLLMWKLTRRANAERLERDKAP
jgi:hypothetical protein